MLICFDLSVPDGFIRFPVERRLEKIQIVGEIPTEVTAVQQCQEQFLTQLSTQDLNIREIEVDIALKDQNYFQSVANPP